TGYHSFVPALIPALGVAQLERTIVNISATMEIITNSAADALKRLTEEVQCLSSVTLQNRLALDIITAQMGRMCTLINTTFCTYCESLMPLIRSSTKIK
ncbi:ERVV2 protein, partial [Tricholaema leucomelas]|nr:ERVV2 protein [Tricholaema leucomelas]